MGQEVTVVQSASAEVWMMAGAEEVVVLLAAALLVKVVVVHIGYSLVEVDDRLYENAVDEEEEVAAAAGVVVAEVYPLVLLQLALLSRP